MLLSQSFLQPRWNPVNGRCEQQVRASQTPFLRKRVAPSAGLEQGWLGPPRILTNHSEASWEDTGCCCAGHFRDTGGQRYTVGSHLCEMFSITAHTIGKKREFPSQMLDHLPKSLGWTRTTAFILSPNRLGLQRKSKKAVGDLV